MFANTYNKNFRLSTEYLAGTFVYYTPSKYKKEYISVVKGGEVTNYNSNPINESNAKAEFNEFKRHLQHPEYDPYRR